MATDREPGRIRLYEDELEEHEKGVAAFLVREKRIVLTMVSFVLATLVMRCSSNQLDQAIAVEKASKHEVAAKHNPWSKD